MNHRDHLTHWNGKPLKSMNQAELIRLCQELNKRYENMRDAAVMRNQPQSERFTSL